MLQSLWEKALGKHVKRDRAVEGYGTAAMAYGIALEPVARQAYISRTGKWVEPACLQSTAYEWLRACSVKAYGRWRDRRIEDIRCHFSVSSFVVPRE